MEKFLQNVFIVGFALLSMVQVNAQDLSNHYSYINNLYNINPAYTGSKEDMEAVMSYRSPWSDIKGVNKNIMAGFHTPFLSHEGMGVRMISDTRGPFKTLIADAQFAHQIDARTGGSMRMGLSAGVVQKRLDLAEEANTYVDFSDPTLKDSYYNQLNFRFGFGILYKLKGLEIGISAPNLVESNSFVNDYIVGNISYKFEVGQTLSFTPIVIYKNLPVSRNQVDLLIRSDVSEKFWIQGGYKTNQSYMAALGFKLKQFGLGYGYEIHKGYLEYLSRDMHEVMMTIQMENNYKFVKRRRKRS